jgi:hypothetical protein
MTTRVAIEAGDGELVSYRHFSYFFTQYCRSNRYSVIVKDIFYFFVKGYPVSLSLTRRASSSHLYPRLLNDTSGDVSEASSECP